MDKQLTRKQTQGDAFFEFSISTRTKPSKTKIVNPSENLIKHGLIHFVGGQRSTHPGRRPNAVQTCSAAFHLSTNHSFLQVTYISSPIPREESIEVSRAYSAWNIYFLYL